MYLRHVLRMGYRQGNGKGGGMDIKEQNYKARLMNDLLG